ncbi:MAG: type II CRISPR RNA-guided endonuclease Cas9 [Bacteroidales bacterium]|nr:type II CRISPR RNA-guided endonuclease Cas9 [Bacteroidales bacterium]
MKKILGLDLGTNSIGWALVNSDINKMAGEIIGLGSRIIPMDQGEIGKFGRGAPLKTSTADRTGYRSVRRLRERHLLRRDRILKILKLMNWLPDKFNPEIDKVAYLKNPETEKFDFLFEESYQEMLNLFQHSNPEIKNIPKDWTIYYLRKKALEEKITPRELAWVILQFNQKRGYYELRSEEEEKESNVKKEFVSAVIAQITDTGAKRGKNIIFEIKLDNGMVGEMQKNHLPDWVGQRKELIASKSILKDGSQTIYFSFPSEDDWALRKKKTESKIKAESKHVGEYILNILIENPKAKIRGAEVHTIERAFYKNELIAILNKQKEYHEELKSSDLLTASLNRLYPNNEAHHNMLMHQDFTWLFVNDIIFYQRPLKSKKSLIGGCKFETRYYAKTDKVIEKSVKCAAKSHPVFQEYRIWALIHNLRVLQIEGTDEKGRFVHDINRTDDFLNAEMKACIFELLNDSKEVAQTKILKALNLSEKIYTLNYEEGKKFKGNDTRARFLTAFKKCNTLKEGELFLRDKDMELRLWHILYSLDKKDDVRKALQNPKLSFPQEAVETFVNLPTFNKDYGSLSVKAMNKLLPLMRCGKYWNQKDINKRTSERINHILTGEVDENISTHVREKLTSRQNINDFQSCPEYLASYIVYNRHSEDTDNKIYTSPDDIERLKQHSLRNPIVEQVVNETLMLVKDIWKFYGKPDEIHIELGRDMKNPAERRKKMSKRRDENEKTNRRAKAMLMELKNENLEINPYSIGQLEIFKIYEEGVLNGGYNIDEEIFKISRKDEPTIPEINRYKLWLDQKYLSPYTGEPIPLSKIFSREFEIEHIIPQSRYFDDSFNNKVICETEVNSEPWKGRQTAYEFICKMGGSEVKLSSGKTITIMKKEDYEARVKKNFKHNRAKLRNLLSYDIPESFINRQLNDTRYISKTVKALLAPIVRELEEKEAMPKNIVPMVGSITNQLKNEWGLNDLWKSLLSPRFKRMNEISGTDDFYFERKDSNGRVHKVLAGHKESIKRLDHRHHALDALVAACTTKDHINYLNALEAESKNYSLIKKLKGYNENGNPNKYFKKPWNNFNIDVLNALSKTVVNFKNNTRVLNKGTNQYLKWNALKKEKIPQKNNSELWAIRQPLHKETVFGKISLRQYKSATLNHALNDWKTIADASIRKKIKQLFTIYGGDLKKVRKHLKDSPIVKDRKEIDKVQVYYYEDFAVTRYGNEINKTFDYKKIEKVSNPEIKRILITHLDKYDGDPEQAFSPEGIEEMNKPLHYPIYKVRLFEAMGKKFRLGDKGNKKDKYVEAAKGTNLFFVIYEHTKTGERIINESSSLALKDVIELQKHCLPLAEEKPDYRWFVLSPGDLVYVPDEEEDIRAIEWENLSQKQVNKIYKMVSCTGSRAFFIPSSVSITIVDKIEFGSLNKIEKANGISIKSICMKLEIDRLGNVKPAKYDSD